MTTKGHVLMFRLPVWFGTQELVALTLGHTQEDFV